MTIKQFKLLRLLLLSIIAIVLLDKLDDSFKKENEPEQNLIAYIEQVIEENPTASSSEEDSQEEYDYDTENDDEDIKNILSE